MFELEEIRPQMCLFSSFCARSNFLPAVKLLFQGGREVSDFLSYLKKEATNTPVVAEEPKKKKKKNTEF